MTEAEALIRKAHRKKNKLFARGPHKYESAAELFGQAGKMLRSAGLQAEAGKAFAEAGACLAMAKQPAEAAAAFASAGACLRGGDRQLAAEWFAASAKNYEAAGRLSMAAKQLQEAGDLYEAKGHVDRALECFERAAAHYDSEHAPGHAVQALSKCGAMRALRGEYGEASDYLERAAREALATELLRFNAKDMLFRSALCYVAKGDAVGARTAVERYAGMDTNFASSRECAFMRKLLRAVDDYSDEQIGDAITSFEQIGRFPPWHANILEKIRKNLEREVRPVSTAIAEAAATYAAAAAATAATVASS